MLRKCQLCPDNKCHFSDEKKRQVYDEYGSFGLYISEQAGEECVPVIMCLQSGWFKVSQVS